MTAPRSARQALRSTFQRFAAAEISISLAVAPACRSTLQFPPMLQLPAVLSDLKAGPGDACATSIDDQSASNSSARIIGREVRTPWPISDFVTHTVTRPSALIFKYAFGEKLLS